MTTPRTLKEARSMITTIRELSETAPADLAAASWPTSASATTTR